MMGRRRSWFVFLLTVMVATTAIDGWAFWTAPGAGSATVSAGSFAAATLSAPTSAANSLTVTWTAQATLVPSSASNSSITYTVERRPASGSYTAIPSGGCSGSQPYGTASCTDAPPATGSYSYRIVAHFASWTATSSESGPVDVLVDSTAPTVSSVTRADASPSNAASVSWTVTFSEAVTGVDSGDFALAASGPSSTSISAVTGSGMAYTVTATSGTGSGTVGLNLADNDTIVDAAANKLGGTGNDNGNLTGDVYTIDKTAPVVSSINPSGSTATSAASVSWTVTFSEAVTGVGAADFVLSATGPAGSSLTSVTGSGRTYTVTAATGTGDGTLGLDAVDDDTITDGVTNRLGGTGTGNGDFTGQTYTIDRTAPTVSSIARANSTPTNAASLSWTVTFSEGVTGVDIADFALARTGAQSGGAIGPVTGGGTTWTVSSTSGTGDGTLGLNLIDNDTIVDSAATALSPSGTGSTTAGQIYTIDKTGPTSPTLVAVTAGGPLLSDGPTCGVPNSTRFINGTGAANVGVTATIAAPVAGQTVSFSAVSGGVTVASGAVTAVTGANVATLNLSASTFPEGPVTLTAKTQDALGNESASAPVTNIVKDVTPPPLSGLSYSDVVSVLGGRDRIQGTSECGARIVAVQTAGGSSTYTLSEVGSGGTFSLNVTAQVLSSYSYNVTATDLAGNAGHVSVVAGSAVL